jgi:hypothetical protein
VFDAEFGRDKRHLVELSQSSASARSVIQFWFERGRYCRSSAMEELSGIAGEENNHEQR